MYHEFHGETCKMRQLEARKSSFKCDRKPQKLHLEEDPPTVEVCENQNKAQYLDSTEVLSNNVKSFLETPVEPGSRRASSCGAPVRRNSSNRSTASEGGTRKRQKPPAEYVEPTFQKGGRQARATEPVCKRDYILTGAASLLRLVIPSLDRIGSRHSDRKSSLPIEESTAFGINFGKLSWQSIRNSDSLRRSWIRRAAKKHSIAKEDTHIPFPQRSPPPVPSSDQLSLASYSSSVAGHTYEQVAYCPDSENHYETCNFVNHLNETRPEQILRDAVSYESVCNIRRSSFDNFPLSNSSYFRSNSVGSLPVMSDVSPDDRIVYDDNAVELTVDGAIESYGLSDYATDTELDADKFYSSKFISVPSGYKCVQLPFSCPVSSEWTIKKRAENYSPDNSSFTSTVSLLKSVNDTAIPEKPGVCTTFANTHLPNCDWLQSRSFTSTYKWNCGQDKMSKRNLVGCERWQLEGEMCRVQAALVERLGSPSVILHRRDQRLHNINGIEKTIQRLRQDASSMAGRESSDEANPTQESLDLLNANQVNFGSPSVPPSRSRDSLIPQTSSRQSYPSFETSFFPEELQSASDLEAISSNTTTKSNQKLHPTIEAVLRGAWPFEKALWHSSPASVGLNYEPGVPESVQTLMSSSSVTNRRAQSQQQLLTNKVEMVYGLLSMFSSGDKDDMSKRLLAMSSSPDSCVAMRQSGCLPLLIQLLHGGDEVPPTRETRIRAAQALQNIVHSHPDDKRGRREARVLRLLSQIREYSDFIYEELERTGAGRGPLLENDMSKHPCASMAAIMKLSFDEDHRHAMCSLGGLHAITEVIRRDHEAHGSSTGDQFCITLRRYAGMALTNLTFGDGTNKTLLCSLRSFMRALVLQLNSPSEELKQVTASILRNLSWRADSGSKVSLREVGAVKALVNAALTAQKESTLKVILSAVWNMSSHCTMNKADICSVDNALSFICSTLTYKSHAKTLSIVENGGGILRNVSSHIAMCDDLRQVLRDQNSMNVLLTHLRSPSLTVVSNACGTLWNLSARCPKDQLSLWEMGAVPMLRSLINSKHKMISMGSSAALKNLLQAKPEGMSLLDQRNGGLPSLQARKQRALVQELDPNLSETCDNIESSPRVSPTSGIEAGFPSTTRPLFHSFGPQSDFMMSESRETVASTHSDKSHDRIGDPPTRRPHNGDQFGPVNHGNPNGSIDLTWASSRNGSETKLKNGHTFGTRQGSRTDSLHSKVSFLDNKYCNGGNKTIAESSSRIQASIDGRPLEEADEDYTTDFSFRYAENGSNNALAGNDSLQTFCTEGTPYETPYPRSNAGSFSDLSETKQSGKISKRSLARKEMHDVEIEDVDESTPSSAVHPMTSMSPVKGDYQPIHYCMEDTPVSLSRYSSVSSISSAEMNENIDKELLEDEKEIANLKHNVLNNQNGQRDNEKEESIDGNGTNYNETPLMFSRTTSIGSLSSMEVQSIHDDRSSVVSDFSRMTSGALSPSDLPDSPSQTMPVTPKKGLKNNPRSDITCSPQTTGFFKETTTAFMDEGTPAEFSCSTSLSNLTYDGYEIPLRARSQGDGKDSSCTNSDSSQPVLARDAQQRRSLPQNRSSVLNSDTIESFSEQRVGQEPTEEMRLAALIHSGMPAKRRPLSGTRSVLSPNMHPVPLPPPPPSVPLDQNQRVSSIPIKTANLTVTVESINLAMPSDSKSNTPGWTGDTLRTFCTEDTPATISQAGSISDLSQISIRTDAGSNISSKSNKSMNTAEDPLNDPHKRQVLENCIQSGMPKPRPIPKVRSSRQKDKQCPGIPPAPKTAIFNTRSSSNHRPVPVARIRPQAVPNDVQQRQKQQDADVKLNKIPVFASKSKGQSFLSYKPNKIEDNADEVPKKYLVENTPIALSRNSSLSSIVDGDDRPCKLKPGMRKYEVENTPVCFSRNSSLSSLSVESGDDETTLREQAVLQKCIREGMPKTKSDLSDRQIPPKRVGGSRIPSLRSPGHADPGLPKQSTITKADPIILDVNSVADSPPVSEFDEKFGKSSISELTTEDSKSTVVAAKISNSNISSPEDQSMANKSVENSSRSFNASLESRGSDNSICDSSALSNEALQMAKVVGNRKNDDLSQMSYSGGSTSDACIDKITPPSIMDQVLSSSNSMLSSNEEKIRYFPNVNRRIECRHTLKSEIIRRALGDHTEGGSLASSCHSNIDNIQPPIMVAEDDMESSMISVASITSEVVEVKDSPSSLGMSMNSEMMGEIAGTAHNLANMLLQESLAQSSATLVAGDDGSTYQELTELDKDETLGAQNHEVAADELNDIPELPFDSPRKMLEHKGGHRSQLLKLKERYRSENSGSSSLDSSRSNSPKSRSPKSSRQRRIDEPERFKTRTIAYRASAPSEMNGNLENFHFNQLTRRSFRQRRQEDPLRYRTRTIASPVTALKDQHDIGSAGMVNFQDDDSISLTADQMEAFSQDANIVVCSLNETREDMMEDASQLLNEENLLDMDTVSLISNDEEDELIRSFGEEAIKLKPRILKPGEESFCTREDETPVGKVVRGRRRGFFHSDRKQSNVACATKSFLNPIFKPTPSKAPVTLGAAKLPRATRASTLRHNSNKSASSGDESSRTVDSSGSAGSSPRIGASTRASASKIVKPSSRNRDAPPSLQRQNTFTKEDKESGSFEKQHQRRVPTVQQRGTCRPKNR